MPISVARTADAWWVVTARGALRIETEAATTAQLLADRAAVDQAVAATGVDAGAVPLDSLDLISPITAPCRVVAQMTNFASHVKDSGMNPAAVPLTFFRKASGSITGPDGDIVKPVHVGLLDYEVEIGLVFGATLEVGASVTEADLGEYVAGLVVGNDVSARDVQLPKTQFYEAKSYPTFTPLGPLLVLLDRGDLARFDELRLRLTVNGEVRQDARVGGDMIYPPAAALAELSRFQRMDPGDVLLTGTPVGTALSAPPKVVELIGSLLPAATKWKVFFKKQASNPKYLRAGDVVEASVATDDGVLDLGTQRNTVRYSP